MDVMKRINILQKGPVTETASRFKKHPTLSVIAIVHPAVDVEGPITMV